jgi:hypothetical protein
MKNDFKIDFIGIGAPKSATTWIFDCIIEHPQVCNIQEKEIGFFNNHYEKGIEYYKSFFKNCSPNSLKGEFTTTYFINHETAERIKQNFPNVKLIVCLRNPIKRAYSQYRAGKGADFIYSSRSFREALDLKSTLIKRGFYYKHLKNYFDIFPRENILVLIYKNIKKDPVKFIQNIYRFLGIDDSYVPENINKRSNKSIDYHFETLNVILYKTYRKLKINKLFKKLNLEVIPKYIKKLNTTSKNQKMKDKTKDYLQNVYRQDIKNLEKLINRDLSFWR